MRPSCTAISGGTPFLGAVERPHRADAVRGFAVNEDRIVFRVVHILAERRHLAGVRGLRRHGNADVVQPRRLDPLAFRHGAFFRGVEIDDRLEPELLQLGIAFRIDDAAGAYIGRGAQVVLDDHRHGVAVRRLLVLGGDVIRVRRRPDDRRPRRAGVRGMRRGRARVCRPLGLRRRAGIDRALCRRAGICRAGRRRTGVRLRLRRRNGDTRPHRGDQRQRRHPKQFPLIRNVV